MEKQREREESGYEADLTIDRNALDVECLDQARRYYRWAKSFVDAVAERDEFKLRLQLTRADVEREVRGAPEKHGLKKGTEGEVKSAVDTHPDVAKGEEELLTLNHRVAAMQVARDSMADRRRMLEKLVDLWLAGYWAEPRVSAQVQAKMSDMASDRQRELLNRSEPERGRKAIGRK